MIERMHTDTDSGLAFNYSFADTPHGKVIIASTPKGIAYLAFIEREAKGLKELRSRFPGAAFTKKEDAQQKKAIRALKAAAKISTDIPLHLEGTDFQLQVWEALRELERGELATYASIAKRIKRPNATRAVGTAIGKNPIAILIPCHRVVRSDGSFGEYRWGATRKARLIESERSATTAQ